ncbi:hypothetical protein [Microvirga flavescens]|uniref:hypothetical protein n=1 Tax=Microvirga flavescens TaxID=2249811 RepID=UPI000DD6818E|nr:hypothetical protein [Microvirga flavescens]
MNCLFHRLSYAALTTLLTASLGGAALGADLGRPVDPSAAPASAPLEWTFRFIPYGWLTAMTGSQTVRGRTVKVNASFADIVEKSDTLVALMGDFEARRGPLAIYGNLVWSNIGAGESSLRTRSLAPGVTGTLGTSSDINIDMAIFEFGVTYEVLRSGALGVDLLAGGRYWHQKADLSFNLASSLDIVDLDLVGYRAIARSGSVDWVDPIIGARLRYDLAPGQNLFLQGDIGGFGAGSKFSWQALGGYGFDFGSYNGITFSGIIGYRALYVDYEQGEGRRRYEFDTLQHGPVVGLSMRF